MNGSEPIRWARISPRYVSSRPKPANHVATEMPIVNSGNIRVTSKASTIV